MRTKFDFVSKKIRITAFLVFLVLASAICYSAYSDTSMMIVIPEEVDNFERRTISTKHSKVSRSRYHRQRNVYNMSSQHHATQTRKKMLVIDNEERNAAKRAAREMYKKEAKQARIQRERHRMLKQTCNKHREMYDTKTFRTRWVYERLRVFEELKLVVCLINKVGTTYWRGLHDQYRGSKLIDYKSKDRRNILREYTTVMVVRHPLVRLRSAYHDRLAGMIPYYLRKYGPKIAKYKDLKKHKEECMATDFEDFLRFIIRTQNQKKINHHWAPYYKLCNPCDITYDVIAKLETFDQDMEFLKEMVAKHPPRRRKTSAITPQKAIIIDACRPFENRVCYYPFLPSYCSEPATLGPKKKETLYLKGYLAENDDIELSTKHKKLWERQCHRKITKMFNTGQLNKTAISSRKIASIKKSFQSLPKPVWNNINEAYELDMSMFDYNPKDVL